MKVCVIEPYYSMNFCDAEKCFEGMVSLLDKCDDTLDVIVLPEYCDIPVSTPNKKAFHSLIEKYNGLVKEKVIETAKRCRAIVFANFSDKVEGGYRNTTFAFDREGNCVGKYYKAHPAPSEVKTESQGGNQLDVRYSYEHRKPYTITVEGVKYGFLTCYDFYFYEYFSQLAREKVDIIIGCSHQRTDTHEYLETNGKFLCYNTNAYLLRSAVTLGDNSPVCGSSMIVAPNGEIVKSFTNQVGLLIADIDPSKKHYKPAGFKGKLKSHADYMEEGRRPWLYRTAGPDLSLNEAQKGYPRICAHRGFNTIAPENSLPAFASAIALGADEIEFDLWETKDNKLVSIHDSTLDRVSNGNGNVWDYTLEELKKLDFGKGFNDKYKGLKIVTFTDILERFSKKTIFNIHVKYSKGHHSEKETQNIVDLIREYDCADYVYVMCDNPNMSLELKGIAPEIKRNAGVDWTNPKDVVEKAIKLKTDKVQLASVYYTQEMIDKAHAHGIKCNMFFSDDVNQAIKMIDMGIDTILTNDYLSIANGVREYIKNKK